MRTSQKTFGAAVLALLLAIALTACGSSSKDGGSSGTTTASKQTLNVFGAASLQTAFTALGRQFEDAHPHTLVNFNFDSSTILSQQIEDNPGTADVFASADEKNMQKLQDAGEVTGTPKVFAKNQMEIAVEPGNPQHVAKVSRPREPRPHCRALRGRGTVREVRRPAARAGQREGHAEVTRAQRVRPRSERSRRATPTPRSSMSPT